MSATGANGPPEADEFVDRLRSAIDRLVDAPPTRWFVAFSGGLDSTLLLHLLRRIDGETPLTAIHVDHGLHPDSAQWSGHCADVAGRLGVDYVACRVEVDRAEGNSIEAEARRARYEAFAAHLGAGDVLLTAHHADDQLETVLLRLLRGTGVRGLTAIHAAARLGAGRVVRPLLGFSRAAILAQARALRLDWLEDPSNADERFDRNYLRARCLPELLARWPHAGVLANRMAGHMGDAEALLGELAAIDLAGETDCVPIDALLALSPARRRNALRFAIRTSGLTAPTASQLDALERELDARADASVCVRWAGAEARIYRRRLYLLARRPEASGVTDDRVGIGRPARLDQGELRLVPADGYGIPDRWARTGLTVSGRRGGERLRPHGEPHHRSLKHWFQEAGIVPWMRSSVPLLYYDDELVAVADLCLVAGLPAAAGDGPFWRPVWSGHERLR